MLDRGVKVKAYHANNGVFRANKWRDTCYKQGQALTFAGVNVHHTNGMAEKCICNLQDLTNTQLIHATHKWAICITVNLWPYALLVVNNILNDTPQPTDSSRHTAKQILSKSVVNIIAKHHMPRGCPCFISDSVLQKNKPFKWKERAKVGIYLGPSPQHGRNVSLVLNWTTGLVSPQFHVHHDPTFSTSTQDKYNSQWQFYSAFLAQTEKRTKLLQTRTSSYTQNNTTPPSKGILPAQVSEGAPTQKCKRATAMGLQTGPPMQSNTDQQPRIVTRQQNCS